MVIPLRVVLNARSAVVVLGHGAIQKTKWKYSYMENPDPPVFLSAGQYIIGKWISTHLANNTLPRQYEYSFTFPNNVKDASYPGLIFFKDHVWPVATLNAFSYQNAVIQFEYQLDIPDRALIQLYATARY
jgi:hypothetical protein